MRIDVITLNDGTEIVRDRERNLASCRIFDPDKISLEEMADINKISRQEVIQDSRVLAYFFSFSYWGEMTNSMGYDRQRRYFLPKEFYKE